MAKLSSVSALGSAEKEDFSRFEGEDLPHIK